MAVPYNKHHKSKTNAEPERDQLGSLSDFIKPTKGYKDEQESSDRKSSSEMDKDSSGKRKASPGN